MSERSLLRRAAVVVMWTLGGVAVLVWWFRRRAGGGPLTPTDPPVWPDLEPSWTPPPLTPEPPPAAATVVPAAAASTWVAGRPGGLPPDGFTVKAKTSSRIFHVPGGRFYERTAADRWYATAEAAEADGYRRSKN